MIKKYLPILVCFLILSNTFSQEKNTLIIGTIIDSMGTVKNATIINLKKNQGTSSNNNGAFRMFLQLGDSLRISSIQHFSKIVTVSKSTIETKIISIFLKPKVYQLDEFELKKHNLSGRLGIDIKGVPSNKKDSLLRDVMDFSKIDFSKVDSRIDANIRMKPPIVNTVPNSLSGGAGGSVSIPFGYSERLWALRRKLAQKKAFPSKILSELGDTFFFKKLKIPVDKYFHFLEYCNPLGIEDLHKNGELLKLIKILREESISYLKMIKKE